MEKAGNATNLKRSVSLSVQQNKAHRFVQYAIKWLEMRPDGFYQNLDRKT